MTPSSEIWLLEVPELEPSYNNTYDFDVPKSQERFFKSKVKSPQGTYVLERYTYLRKESAIKVNLHIDDLHTVNYLMYKNKFNKWYYAFILDKIYINEKTTQIIIATDLLQTYMFDYTLEESYVDRCHVDRWKRDGKPTDEFENENLEYGEYIQSSTEAIYVFQKSYVAVCSSPLGVLENRKQEGGQGGFDDIECGDYKNGIISPKGLRFIKGEEGYAPNKYFDRDGKVWTIGYGVTQPSEPDAYNYLVNKNGASEEDCAKVSYYLKNERYGKAIIKPCEALGIDKQYEFDALVSFVYNLGTGVLAPGRDIYDTILRYKKGQATPQQVIDTFKRYNTSGGQVLPGLTIRREQEGKMFCNMPYNIKQISTIIDYGKYGPPLEGDGWLPNCNDTGDFDNLGVKMKYPCHGTITAKYPSYPSGGYHSGTDIANKKGTPIYAMRKGKVIERNEWNNSYGYHLIIEDDDGFRYWYAHCDKLLVNVGDVVQKGQQIANMGATGKVFGDPPDHLHIEIRRPPYKYDLDNIDPIPNVKVGDNI